MSPLQKTGLYAAGTAAATFATFTLMNWSQDEPVTISDLTASLAAGVAVAVFRTIPPSLDQYFMSGYVIGLYVAISGTRYSSSIKTKLSNSLIGGLICVGIFASASVAGRFTISCVKAAPAVFDNVAKRITTIYTASREK